MSESLAIPLDDGGPTTRAGPCKAQVGAHK